MCHGDYLIALPGHSFRALFKGGLQLRQTQSCQLCQVIPFGPYLEDDFNYAKLNYVRLFAQARADSVMITIKASDWQLDKTDY